MDSPSASILLRFWYLCLIRPNCALDERMSWVVPVVGAKPEARITLTFPAIASSKAVVFLVAGADKQPIIARLRRGDQALPAARVEAAGELRWFLDRAATGDKEG